MLIRKFILAVVAGLVATASAQAQSPASVPVEAFFQNPAFSGGTLSPNGRYLAIKVAAKGGRMQLVAIDVEKLTAKALVSPTDVDIDRVTWVNDNRLVFTVHDSLTAVGDTLLGGGLYAVSRDGSDYRQLVDRTISGVREMSTRTILPANTQLVGPTREQKSDDVFVAQAEVNSKREVTAATVMRLNTLTGRATPLSRPNNAIRYVIDKDGTPRAATSYDKGRMGVHVLQADGKWVELANFDLFSAQGFIPVEMAQDGKSLFVHSRNGGDKDALYRYDLEKRALDPQPIFALKDFDFNGQLMMGANGPIAIRYISDAEATVWFDEKWKAVQAKVDALLPNTVNHMEVPLRPELPFVMVRAFSDVDPGTYLLFNTETSKLTLLGPAMPDIDPRRMARVDFVRYKARDGMDIPAWVTTPQGAKGRKLPTVVLVHGGPWVRGADWRWRSQSQFLASRGYLVVEPEFRGSLGFGDKHFRSSFKQWGLTMQDDVADAARWAIAQGTADPDRICVAGASYGGYATMMALVKDPELFKCGVNWVGVTDIDLMFSVSWSDVTEAVKTYTMTSMIGDPEKDAAYFKQVSPIEQAAKIKRPVLMAYGGSDQRVPIVHGTKMRAAIERAGNNEVEWIEYKEEGHGWALVKNRVDFWTRVEKFLGKHIGPR